MKTLHKIEPENKLVDTKSQNPDSANIRSLEDFRNPIQTFSTKKECIASYDKNKNIERICEILRLYATPEWVEGILKELFVRLGPKENPQIVKERNIQKTAEFLKIHTEPEYVEALLTRLIERFHVQDKQLTIVNETDYWGEF